MRTKRFLIILVAGMAGCHTAAVKPAGTANAITAIEYQSEGGDMPYYFTLNITPDSVIAAESYKHLHRSTANTKASWDSIVQLVNLTDIEKIKDGSSRKPYDGSDETVIIHTNDTTCHFTNGFADSNNYKKVLPLINRLTALAGTLKL